MKIIVRWLLYKYVGGEFTPLSKPFKTKEQAEWARLKYPERERGAIGVGVIRIEKFEYLVCGQRKIVAHWEDYLSIRSLYWEAHSHSMLPQ